MENWDGLYRAFRAAADARVKCPPATPQCHGCCRILGHFDQQMKACVIAMIKMHRRAEKEVAKAKKACRDIHLPRTVKA
jgi:hypothetical protein